jgi:HEAT repeat protein
MFSGSVGTGSSDAEDVGQAGAPSPQATEPGHPRRFASQSEASGGRRGNPDGAAGGTAELLGRLDSEDAYTRQLAFLKLEALREPATAPAIAAHLTSRDEDTRAQVLRALAAIQGAAAVPTLLEAFKTDRRPRVRRAALLALEPLREADPEVLPLFLRALRDRKPQVRMAAVDIVSRIDDPKARDAVRVRYKRERDRDVRRVLAEAIKRVGAP